MATIVEGQKEWSAIIRCAHPSFGSPHRVDGCFALIQITLADIKHTRDYEGDISFWVECPSCGQRLYPEWQVGRPPLANSLTVNARRTS